MTVNKVTTHDPDIFSVFVVENCLFLFVPFVVARGVPQQSFHLGGDEGDRRVAECRPHMERMGGFFM